MIAQSRTAMGCYPWRTKCALETTGWKHIYPNQKQISTPNAKSSWDCGFSLPLYKAMEKHCQTGAGLPLFFFFIFFISWRLIILQYCSHFCHTLTRISHDFTYIPHHDHPSHLPLTMRYHYTPVRMAAIQKSTSNKCWRGCGGKGIILCSLLMDGSFDWFISFSLE